MNVNPDLLRTPTHQMTTRYRNIPIGSRRFESRGYCRKFQSLAFYCKDGVALGGQRAAFLVFWVARLYFSKFSS